MKKPRFNPFNRNMLTALITICFAILFYVLLSNFAAVRKQLAAYFTIIAPFFVAVVIAFLLNRPMMFFEKKLFKKFKFRRGFSILTVYILGGIIISAILSVIIPQVANSINMLWGLFDEAEKNLPQFVASFNLDPQLVQKLFGSWEDIITSLTKQIQNLIPKILSFSFSVSNGFIKALMALFASIYMLASKEKLISQFKKILYAIAPINRAKSIISVANQSNRVFSDFIVGKLLDSAIIGVMCFVGMLLIYNPYAVLISVIIGVTNIIPFFGPFIGAIPCALILLIVDPIKCLIFLVFILALQQFDGNYLGPRILGNSTGLSPLWVLVAITVGGGLFGFMGMLFGVPTFAVIYDLVGRFVNIRLAGKKIDGNGNNIAGDNCNTALPATDTKAKASVKDTIANTDDVSADK